MRSELCVLSGCRLIVLFLPTRQTTGILCQLDFSKQKYLISKKLANTSRLSRFLVLASNLTATDFLVTCPRSICESHV